ncbi:MAG TPA: TRAP transporter small permease [Vicinamibacteria bacterium]|nr:TRAP transporter small permease [Vicinamibacteria bacterium]
MNAFISVVGRASRFFGMLAAFMIGLSVMVVCHLVFVRYVLRSPTAWQTELVTYLLVGATLVGSPYVLMIRGHVGVDLLPLYLSDGARRRLALGCALAGIIFCGVLLWSGLELWYEAWAGDWLSETVWAVPLWIPYASLPLGFGLMLLQYIADVLALLTGHAGAQR